MLNMLKYYKETTHIEGSRAQNWTRELTSSATKFEQTATK